MKSIYIVNAMVSGINGVTSRVEATFTNCDTAIEAMDRLNREHAGDPNYLAYITGPVLLNDM